MRNHAQLSWVKMGQMKMSRVTFMRNVHRSNEYENENGRMKNENETEHEIQT